MGQMIQWPLHVIYLGDCQEFTVSTEMAGDDVILSLVAQELLLPVFMSVRIPADKVHQLMSPSSVSYCSRVLMQLTLGFRTQYLMTKTI